MRTSFFGLVTLACLALACGKESAPPADAEPSIGPDGDDWRGPVDRALAAIAAHPEAVAGGPDHAFEPVEVVVEAGGQEHVRFDRRFKGLRVLGGDAVTHVAQGKLEDASLTLTAPLAPEVSPGIAGPDAAVLAGLPGEVSELVVYTRGPASALAYEVAGSALLADGTPSEPHAIVDAQSGEILDRWDGVATAAGTGQGYFSGKVALETTAVSHGFALQDPTRGNLAAHDLHGATRGTGALFTDGNDTWGDGTLANRQSLAVDAQYAAAVTWDFFAKVMGRRGVAGDGRGPSSRLHYGNGYDNAFWSDACFCMTYGDGDGTDYDPFVSLDIVGHELSHGVTSHTARLRYSGEPGGLNEATSDIFGTLIEFYAQNPQDPPDYTIGERIMRGGGALRSMAWPEHDHRSVGCWEQGVGALDVHYSSGIANHFFYLLAEGTSHATHACGTGLTVTGIGRLDAGKIWYRALTRYFTSATSFHGARAATLRAAADLFGKRSAQYAAVGAAWAAVKVD